MSIDLQVSEAVFSFALVAAGGLLLRRTGVLAAEDGPKFARLLTQAVLPVAIFTQLMAYPPAWRQAWMILAVVVAGLAAMAASYLAGRILRLERPAIGALMLTSSFGSSTLLGYPLVEFAFPHDPQAMTDAVLLSEVGVGLPLFVLGPAVARAFGEGEADGRKGRGAFLAYFRSPIFAAVVLGLVLGPLQPDLSGAVAASVMEALRMMAAALTLLACMVLALQLRLESLRGLWPLLVVSGIIQMGLQPWVASLQGGLYPMSGEQRQVLTLISSMPSAVLGSVFAARYRCAGETASALIAGHLLMALVLVPLVYAVLN